MANPIYLYTPAHRSLLVEVYFPKKVAYQGTIFTALEEGYNENIVKRELRDSTRELIAEFAAYPFDLLDPYRYGKLKKPMHPESAISKARKRIKLYESQFYGWSMYEVDGVFFNRRGKTYEESTQIVRLIFRFSGKKMDRYAKKIGCDDVFRSIIFFILRERGQIAGEARAMVNPIEKNIRRETFFKNRHGGAKMDRGLCPFHIRLSCAKILREGP